MPLLRTLTIRGCEIYDDDRDTIEEEIEFKALQVETLIIRSYPIEAELLPRDQERDEERMMFVTCAPNVKQLILSGGYQHDFINLSAEEFKVILKTLVKLEEFVCRGTIEIDDEVPTLITQSKLRHITIEYDTVNLTKSVETCENLEAASAQLNVAKKLVTLETGLEDVHFIYNLFESPRE